MEWNEIIWNEIELCGMKWNYSGMKFIFLELKLMNRNVLGVSLQGMSPSIVKTIYIPVQRNLTVNSVDCPPNSSNVAPL